MTAAGIEFSRIGKLLQLFCDRTDLRSVLQKRSVIAPDIAQTLQEANIRIEIGDMLIRT